MEWYTLSILVFLFLCHFCRRNKKFSVYGFSTFLEDFEYIFYVLSHQTHSKIATESFDAKVTQCRYQVRAMCFSFTSPLRLLLLDETLTACDTTVKLASMRLFGALYMRHEWMYVRRTSRPFASTLWSRVGCVCIRVTKMERLARWACKTKLREIPSLYRTQYC